MIEFEFQTESDLFLEIFCKKGCFQLIEIASTFGLIVERNFSSMKSNERKRFGQFVAVPPISANIKKCNQTKPQLAKKEKEGMRKIEEYLKVIENRKKGGLNQSEKCNWKKHPTWLVQIIFKMNIFRPQYFDIEKPTEENYKLFAFFLIHEMEPLRVREGLIHFA